jgi:hypothetical protein
MPIQKCQRNDKPGYKWGEEGKCYTYEPGDEASRERAYQKALQQARAIKASGGE